MVSTSLRGDGEVVVQELSKLHGHVGQAPGGDRSCPAGARRSLVQLVRHQFRPGQVGGSAGRRDTVSVGRRGQPTHGDASRTKQFVFLEIVADSVDPSEQVTRSRRVANYSSGSVRIPTIPNQWTYFCLGNMINNLL